MLDYRGPLSRIKVLDLTRVRAGPTAVRQLADWGADVIKIEAPAAIDKAEGIGGERDGPDFQNIHRNKRGITLNLKEAEGRDLFMRMVETADVVAENYRPGVKTRLGIDYQSLKTVNPRIVLLSISGFGQDGPYAERPGFDQIAQGMGGLMSITGLPGQGPVRVGIPVADLAAGMYGAMGVLIALLEREATREGQWVTTSLLQAMIATLDFQAARYLVAGEVPPQAGNDHPTVVPTGVFETRDGHVNLSASGDRMWQRICDLFDDDKMRTGEGLRSEDERRANRKRVNAKLNEHICRMTSSEAIEKLNAAGVPCGPIYDIGEMFRDPQVRHIDMRHPVRHKRLGDLDLVGQGVHLSRHVPRTGMATPDRGEHNDEVLREYGFDDAAIADLRARAVI